jgi:DNA-binding transcriptional MerR regulator
MYTIGRLAKIFELSRSTLLYYDRKGLLAPSNRTTSNYREYSEKDRRKLEQICLYRDCGLSLTDIARILGGSKSESAEILETHLEVLNRRIADLRSQQHVILSILKKDLLGLPSGMMNTEKWSSMLRAAGLDDKGMRKWHMEFEKLSPQEHVDFLRSLGISDEEIDRIRAWSGKEE